MSSAAHQINEQGRPRQIVQFVQLTWNDPEESQPKVGKAVWVALEDITDDGSPGERCFEFAEYSPETFAEFGGWALIGGTPVGPDQKIVAWAEEPELPPRFDDAPVADTDAEEARLAP